MKKIGSALICFVAFLLFLQGCTAKNVTQTKESDSTVVENDTESNAAETIVETVYLYKPVYRDVVYFTQEEKEVWRPYLEILIAKLHHYDTYEWDEEYQDYSLTAFGSSGLALFDIDADGTPELFEMHFGGSAQNVDYRIYDLLTGDEIGSLDDDTSFTWKMYLNARTGEYEAWAQYQWREGFDTRIRYLSRASISRSPDDDQSTAVVEDVSLHMRSCLNRIVEGENIEYDDYSVRYYNRKNEIGMDTFYDQYTSFLNACVPIADTGITVFLWWDYTDSKQTQEERAVIMTDLLLGSDQKFIKPE